MVQRFNECGETPEKINILQANHLISTDWDITTSTIQNCWAKANITTTSIPALLSIPVDNFITEQHSAYLQAFHEFRELGETDCQNFNDYFECIFTDNNHPWLQIELSESTELFDSTTLIEREITNGLLEHSTSELNGTVLTLGPAEDDSDYQSSQQWISYASPPLII